MLISIVGSVGLPANYGGFETLVENLVSHHSREDLENTLEVFCSSQSYDIRKENYLKARLRYLPFRANGPQSIVYDIFSICFACFNRSEIVLVLGVSGAIVLPLIRLISSAKIITNIDGVEWKRDKWSPFAMAFLRFSEKIAVRYSHTVIADNDAIADYVHQAYGVSTHVIPYGGDHAVFADDVSVESLNLPKEYIFSVCRIEPENNIHLIIEAFINDASQSLVVVGNWLNSEYGLNLRQKCLASKNIFLLDPIYDLGKLKTLRSKAFAYVHGHSAGGTNPSLVEAMHFGRPVIAYDCEFNRCTTENQALFFKTPDDIISLLSTMNESESRQVGESMLEIARRRYTWDVVAKQYFDLLTA